MKTLSIVALTFALSACSTQAVKCRGPLRPINKPVVTAKHAPVDGHQAASSPAPAEVQP